MKALSRISSGVLPASRLPKPVIQQLEAIRNESLGQAARAMAAAHVTSVALRLTAGLTTQEGLLIQQCPLGEARYRLLVDNFTAVAAGLIAELGL